MTYRSFSLIPSLSNNIISDRFTQMDNLFSRITGEKPLSDTPNYDLIQKNKDNYELTISVPGYSQENLDISVLNNQLKIIGKNELEQSKNEKEDIKWLHKGIKKSSFSLIFNLDHRININKAYLDKGLLKLKFTYDIPEEEKPKKISITINNSDTGKVINKL